MGSLDINQNNVEFDMPKNQSNSIKVIGVGGGGSNAVNYMFQQHIKGVDFLICNTDAQALHSSPIPNKIQLGASLTEGLGAGANPEIGKKSAEESLSDIQALLSKETKMVFITAGMGGGTGTGAAPIIASLARDMGILTVGIVTMPFEFEGRHRMNQARKGIELLREQVDSLIVINNQKLRMVYGNLGFKEGFGKADEVLSTAAKGIAEVITHHYKQNIDLNDAKRVLANSGTAIMGSAKDAGENRAEAAVKRALDSPLLNDNKITGAKNVLLLIVSGKKEATLDEIGRASEYIQAEAGYHTDIILGVGEDESLDDAIAITVVATGFAADQQDDIVNLEGKKVVHTLEGEQRAEHTFDAPKNTIIPQKEAIQETPVQLNDIKEEKVVHTLDISDFSDEEPTESLKNPMDMDVVDFKIIDVNPQMEFDTPHVVESEISEHTNSETQQEQDSFKEQMSLFDIEVNDMIEVRADEKSPTIVYDLGSIQEEEEDKSMNTGFTSSTQNFQPTIKSASTLDDRFKRTPSQDPVLRQEVKEDDLGIELRTAEPIKEEVAQMEVKDHKEISPLNASISELRSTAQQRRAHMKDFNYKFKSHPGQSLEDLERVPAFKRQGIEIENRSISQNQNQSRLSVSTDENEDLKIRKNNSFLHDNVD